MVRSLIAAAVTGFLGVWSFLAWSGLGMAQAGSPFAAEMPFNQATAAQRQLLSGTFMLTTEQRTELAQVALRRAPLSAQPLAFMALLAEQAGNEPKTQSLIEAAAQQGWHDEAVQRILYNWAASGNDHVTALRHAEAMLRQGLAAEDLTADFARKAGDPGFRSALVAMLSKKGAWADRWAGLEAPRLDNSTLAALFASPQFRKERSDQSLTILASELVDTGRARLAWRLAHGGDSSRPLRLDWQPETDFPARDVFAWQVPTGYTVVLDEGAQQQIKRQDASSPEPVRLRLGLEPGRYRIAFIGADPAAKASWRAGFACDQARAAPVQPVASVIELTVDQSCQQQSLLIAADTGAGSPLPPPVLQRLED
ncbi:hypothetical protein OKA06_01535 [Novosphingobium sp. MW5]|nr:hypothetical protein [Novosphingobium sp. MW5]